MTQDQAKRRHKEVGFESVSLENRILDSPEKPVMGGKELNNGVNGRPRDSAIFKHAQRQNPFKKKKTQLLSEAPLNFRFKDTSREYFVWRCLQQSSACDRIRWHPLRQR